MRRRLQLGLQHLLLQRVSDAARKQASEARDQCRLPGKVDFPPSCRNPFQNDPRGLVGGPSIDQTTLDAADWQDHIRETQSSLRVIAELTGGIAGVNTNNFTGLLKRIDGETSDYYVLGYNSSNPDPLKKRRAIEIRVKQKPKLQLTYKTSYTLKPER